MAAVKPNKKCKRCGLVKPRTEFTRIVRCKNAVIPNCRICEAEVAREKYARTPKEKTALINRKSKLKRAFGLTLEQYDEMLAAQGGVCAICGSDKPAGRGAFIVDHCHITGRIRGLLCTQCNTGIGHLRDSISILKQAITYLANGGVDYVIAR